MAKAGTGAPVAGAADTPFGFDELVGQTVVIICAVYIYTGRLVGVGETSVKLEQAQIVYETGPWSQEHWAEAKPLPFKYTYVARCFIESFGAKAPEHAPGPGRRKRKAAR